MSLTPDDNLGDLLGAMSQLREQLTNAQALADARLITGSAAGGRVQIEVSGEFSFDKVSIDPSVVDVNDLALLEDLVLAALRDCATRLKAARTQAMGGAVSEALSGLFGSGDHDPAR